MLAVIQDQAWALWNDFLEPEFGFKEDHLQVTLSDTVVFTCTRDPALFTLIRKPEGNWCRTSGARALTSQRPCPLS